MVPVQSPDAVDRAHSPALSTICGSVCRRQGVGRASRAVRESTAYAPPPLRRGFEDDAPLVPSAVAPVAGERLHDLAGERRRQPQHGDLVRLRPEVLVDGAHVGHLHSPAELDAEEAKPKFMFQICRNDFADGQAR